MELVVLMYVCFSQHAPGENERQEDIARSCKATLKRIFPNNSRVVYRLS